MSEYKGVLGLIEEDAFKRGFKEGLKESLGDAFQRDFKEGFKESFKDAFKRGFKEGYTEVIAEIARKMIQGGLDLQDIAQYTNLSMEQLETLQKSAST